MRKMKKFLVFAIVLLLACSTPAGFLPADAGVMQVMASTAKISAKKATLGVGETKKLTIKGTKKKVTWSSSKKSVATVSKSGKVTAKKIGTAKITGKFGSKKLTCKVTVVSKNVGLAANVSYTLHKFDTGVVAILHNNNAIPIKMETQLIFKNAAGGVIHTYTDFNYGFESQTDCVQYFQPPRDGAYQLMDYAGYELRITAEPMASSYRYYSKNVSYTSNMDSEYVYIDATNTSTEELDFIHFSVVFFDAGGSIIGYESGYADCKLPGESTITQILLDRDANYNVIQAASYKVYLDCAYKN